VLADMSHSLRAVNAGKSSGAVHLATGPKDHRGLSPTRRTVVATAGA